MKTADFQCGSWIDCYVKEKRTKGRTGQGYRSTDFLDDHIVDLCRHAINYRRDWLQEYCNGPYVVMMYGGGM